MIRQGQTQTGNAEAVEQSAKTDMTVGLRVPVGQDNDCTRRAFVFFAGFGGRGQVFRRRRIVVRRRCVNHARPRQTIIRVEPVIAYGRQGIKFIAARDTVTPVRAQNILRAARRQTFVSIARVHKRRV